MNTDKIVNEMVEYYKIYKKAQPYAEFSAFVESLKRTNNTALIENIQEGICVFVESVTSALKKLQSSNPLVRNYLKWFVEGRQLFTTAEGKEKLKKALQDTSNEENKLMLLKSIFPILAQQVDGKVKQHQVYEERGIEEGDETSFETFKNVIEYFLSYAIEKFDPSKLGEDGRPATFPTYAQNIAKREAQHKLLAVLGSPKLGHWNTGQNYKIEKSADGILKPKYLLHDHKTYRRKGPEEIPVELRDTEPTNEDVLDIYWEQASVPSGRMAESRIIPDVAGAEEDTGSAETAGSDASIGQVSMEEKGKIPTPEEEYESTSMFDKIDKIIDSFKKADENLRNYMKKRFRLELTSGKLPDSESEKLANEFNMTMKNSAHRTRISRMRKAVTEKMQQLGKEHFMG